MENLKLFVGTYSVEKIADSIKSNYTKGEVCELLLKGQVFNGQLNPIVMFFCENTPKAKIYAKEMDLSFFAVVSEITYKKGQDY